ncbi:ABC transporter substrate-binding protein [Myxococcota bacterium]
MRIGSFARRISWGAFALSAIGCGSSDSTRSTTQTVDRTSEGETIEFFSALNQPGDVEALQALVDVHQRRHPGDQVINTAVSFMELSLLDERIAAGNPPDVFMTVSHVLPTYLPLYPLDEFLASESQAGVEENTYSELLAETTIDGKICALPWGVTRNNALFYNKHVFREHKLSPPTTISELLTVCQTLNAAGVTPAGATSLAFAFPSLLAGAMGTEAFYSFETGGVPDETELGNAIDVVAEVLESCFDPHTLLEPDMSDYEETSALMSGETAMFFNGDWTSGALQQLGWTPGIDYGILAAPGTEGLFVYMSMVLAIPAGAPHIQGALNFLDSVGSVEGHIAFDTLKDGTAARKDMDLSVFDSERRGVIEDMIEAEYRVASTRDWDTLAYGFMQSKPHDKEALLQALTATP